MANFYEDYLKRKKEKESEKNNKNNELLKKVKEVLKNKTQEKQNSKPKQTSSNQTQVSNNQQKKNKAKILPTVSTDTDQSVLERLGLDKNTVAAAQEDRRSSELQKYLDIEKKKKREKNTELLKNDVNNNQQQKKIETDALDNADERAKYIKNAAVDKNTDRSVLERLGISEDEAKDRFYDDVLPSEIDAALKNVENFPYQEKISKIRRRQDVIDFNNERAGEIRKNESQAAANNWLNMRTQKTEQLGEAPVGKIQSPVIASPTKESTGGLLVPEDYEMRLMKARRDYQGSKMEKYGSAETYEKAKPEYEEMLITGMQSDEFAKYYQTHDNTELLETKPFTAANYGHKTGAASYVDLNEQIEKYKGEMADYEISYFNYLWEKNEIDAKNYMEMILPSVQARAFEKQPDMNGFEQAYYNFMGGAIDTLTSAGRGFQTAQKKGNYWVDGAPMDGQNYMNYVNAKAQGGQKFVNNLSRSTGNMATVAALNSLGIPLGSYLNALNTYNNKYQSSMENGFSEEEAKKAAGLSSVTNFFLEKAGGINNVSAGKGLFNKLLQSKAGQMFLGTKTGQKALKASAKVSSKLASNEKVKIYLKNTVKSLANSSDEAFEEYIQTAIMEPLINSYSTGAPLEIDLMSEEALEDALMGFATATILNAPSDISKLSTDIHNYNVNERMETMKKGYAAATQFYTGIDTRTLPEAPKVPGNFEMPTVENTVNTDYRTPRMMDNKPVYSSKTQSDLEAINAKRQNTDDTATLLDSPRFDFLRRTVNAIIEKNKNKRNADNDDYKSSGDFSSSDTPKSATTENDLTTDKITPNETSVDTEQNNAVLEGDDIHENNVLNAISPEARNALSTGNVTNNVVNEITNAAYYELQRSPDMNNGLYSATKKGATEYAKAIIERAENKRIERENKAKGLVNDINARINAQNESDIKGEGDLDNINNTDQFMITSPPDEKNPKSMTAKEKLRFEGEDAQFALKEFDKANNTAGRVTNATNVAKNAKARAERSITEAQYDFYGNKVGKSIENILGKYLVGSKSLNKSAEKVKKKGLKKGKNVDRVLKAKDYKMLQKLVYNLHDIARSREGKALLRGESKLTQSEIDSLLKMHPEYKQTLDELVIHGDNLRQYMVDSQLISKETAQMLKEKYPFYMPSHRDIKGAMNDNGDVTGVGNIIETAVGSELDILPLHEQLQTQEINAFRMGEVNKVFNDIADVFIENGGDKSGHVYAVRKAGMIPDEGKFDKDGNPLMKPEPLPDFSLEFRRNGERYIMEMDEFMYEGMKDLVNGMHVDVNKLLENANKAFKAVTTDYNPVFSTQKNPTKDLFTAFLNTNYPVLHQLYYIKNATVPVAKSLINAPAKLLMEWMGKEGKPIGDNQWWKLYMAYGNTTNTFVELRNDTNSYGKTDFKGLKGKAKFVGAPLNQAAWYLEQLPRFSEFMATLKVHGFDIKKFKEGKLTATDRALIEKASRNAARVTTDFKTSGKTARKLNKGISPYLNAEIQGKVQMINRFTDVKLETDSKGKMAAKLFLKAMQLGSPLALGFALSAAHSDEEWYKKKSEFDKERYIYFTKNFKLLKSEAQNILDKGGAILASWLRGDSNEQIFEHLREFGKEFLVNPIDKMPLISTYYNLKNNKTYYGADIENANDIKARTGDTNGSKASLIANIHDENTSEIAKWICQSFGSMMFEWSPKQVDYFIGNIAGYYGDLAIELSTKENFKHGTAEGLGKAFVEPFTKHVVSDELKDNQISTDYYTKRTQYGNETQNGGTAEKLTETFFNSTYEEIEKLNKEYKLAEDNNDRNEQIRIKNEKEKIMLKAMDETPKYKEAAKKILNKYPDFDYETATDREIDLMKMRINNEYGGEEYALKQDSTMWEKAVEGEKEHGISYKTSYAVQEFKKTLPMDVTGKEKAKALEKFFRQQVDSGMEEKEANAAGDFYIDNSIRISQTNTYNFHSDEDLILSKKSETGRQKYEWTKEKFDNFTPERYEEVLAIYNKGATKNEKLFYLMDEGGLDKYSAEVFYKIHSGSKGYKTESMAAHMREQLNMPTSWINESIDGYLAISHVNSDEETKMKENYINAVVDEVPDKLLKQYGNDRMRFYRFFKSCFEMVEY